MGLHRMVTLNDEGVRVVSCPDCGQTELWTEEDVWDHGLCRTYPVLEDGCCPVCGEEWPPAPTA